MPTVICMLRAVNVGGHNRVPMAELRALCASLKLRNPQTYVQSGNVIFATDERDQAKLARRLQNAIEKQFSCCPEVILRTADELRQVVARNPFAKRRDVAPNKLLVLFLATDPGEEARAKVRAMRVDPEEVKPIGREVYIHFPIGMGKSKLQWTSIEKTLGTPGTGRNWNSVTKMLEIAEGLPG